MTHMSYLTLKGTSELRKTPFLVKNNWPSTIWLHAIFSCKLKLIFVLQAHRRSFSLSQLKLLCWFTILFFDAFPPRYISSNIWPQVPFVFHCSSF